MMRFGCGAHMVHGGHGSHGNHGQPAESGDTDPVCGMQVAADSGYAKVYQGKQYRFCSRNCLDKFDADPQQYLGKEPS
jgi:YHS domain-containing protein